MNEEELQLRLSEAGFLFQNQENEECIRVLNEILEENVNNEIALALMGQVFIRFNLYDIAENFLVKAFKINNQNGEIHVCLGNIEQARGNIENAYELYCSAIELGVEDISLYLNIGLIAEEIGNYDVAVEAYDRALFVEPNNLFAFRKMVDILYKSGEYETAVDTCSDFIEANVQIYEGYSLKLAILMDLQEYDTADRTMEQASVYFADLPEYIFDFVRLKKQEKSFDEAHDFLEKNYDKVKHLEELYLLEKANILSLLDRVEEAQLMYDDLRIKYANREAIFALQVIALKNLEFSTSMSLADELVTMSANDNIYYYSLFFRCFASVASDDKQIYIKKCSETLEIMNEVDEEDVNYVFLYIMKAALAMVIGRKDEAEKDIEKIKQWNPNLQLADITSASPEDFL